MADDQAGDETKLYKEIRSRAFRPLLACGLCFALLLMMGLSGVASITLMYDDPMYVKAMKGVEGAVARAVMDMDWAIRLLHAWGGYVGIMLAGWAGIELLSYGRRLKKTDDAGWRKAGRRLPIIGVAGAGILIVSLVVLIASGIAAKGFVETPTPEVEGLPDPGLNNGRLHQRDIQPENERAMVEWHTRELNYLMAFGAIILVIGASSVRTVSLEAKAKL